MLKSLAQSTPTLSVCDNGGFNICLKDSIHTLCVIINKNDTATIDSFIIKWKTNGPSTTLKGPGPFPNQTFTYNLSDFYNRSCQYETQEDAKLFFYYRYDKRNQPGNIGSTFTFRNPPKPNFSIRGTRCVGQSLNFTNTSCPSNTTVVAWDYGDGFRNNTGNHMYTREGDYDVKLIVQNPCGIDSTIQRIKILSLPTAITTIKNQAPINRDTFEICLNRSRNIELDGSQSQNSTHYQWLPSTSQSGWNWITRSDTITPKISITQAGIYAFSLETNNDCNQKSTAKVVIKVLAPLNLPNPGDGCNVFDYKFTPTLPTATYEHIFNGISQGFFNPTQGFRTEIGTHEIIGKSTGACNDEQRISFTIQSPQAISITLPSSHNVTECPNTGLIPIELSRYDNITASSNVIKQGNRYFFNTKTARLGSRNVITFKGICSTGDSLVINIRDTIPSSLDSISPRCKGFIYRPSKPVQGGIYTFNGKEFDPTKDFKIDTSGVIRLVVTDSCNSDTLYRYAFVTGVERLQLISKDTVVCWQSGSFPLLANPNSGIWFGDAGIINNRFNPYISGIGTRFLKYKLGVGECENIDSIKVNVQGVRGVDAGNDTLVCNNAQTIPILLNKGVPSGGVYRLNDTDGEVVTQINPSTLPPSRYNIYYVVNDTGTLGCQTYDSLFIDISGIPNLPENTFPQQACVGKPVSINLGNSQTGTINKLFVNDTIVSPDEQVNYLFKSKGTKRILLEVSNGTCKNTLQDSIIVKSPPRPSFRVSGDEFCSGQMLYVTNETQFNDATTIYKWVFKNKTVTRSQIDSIPMINTGCSDSVFVLRLIAKAGVCDSVVFEKNITIFPKTRTEIGIQGPDSICANSLVIFNDNTCGKVFQKKWTINGQQYNTLSPPKLHFANDSDTVRIISASLIVEGICRNDTSNFRFFVYPLVIKARFSMQPRRTDCPPLKVTLRVITPYASRHIFYIDDTITNDKKIVETTLEKEGLHYIKLRVFHPCGGYDEFIDSIRILSTAITNGLTYTTPNTCRQNVIQIRPNIIRGVLGRIWIDSLKIVDSLSSSPIITFPNAGSYWVKYRGINESTGCSTLDSGLVVVKMPISFKQVVLPDSCGNGNGAAIFNVIGGTGKYRFSKNDTTKWQDNGEFRGLKFEETYTFFIQDTEGCQLVSSIKMNGREPLSINVGADTSISLCDTFCRQLTTNRPLNSVFWKFESGTGTITHPNQIKTTFQPNESSIIYVLATDNRGCKADSRFNVGVSDSLKVFVPNAFSPNNDGVNDKFRPYFRVNTLKIIEFNIFNRWGVLVHSVKNVSADSEELDWDGFFKGTTPPKNILPEVFVWTLRVEHCNGIISPLKFGGVTLLR